MRIRIIILFGQVFLGCGMMAQVRLDDPPFFQQYGEKSFPHAKAACMTAVERYLTDSGHGVEKADPASGKIISGRANVYRGVEGTSTNSGSKMAAKQIMVDNKFYVQVSGDEKTCTVSVKKLRAWTNGNERETETKSWTGAHLTNLIKGVENNLKDDF